MGTYSSEFFMKLHETSSGTANQIVPLVIQLTGCRSVVDLGCGTGEWLAEFLRNGVADVVGLDGDYVDRALLRIPQTNFVAYDLQRPYKADRRFDLAMSLETAEHLPPECAATVVETLVGLSDLVLFSAAVPHQTGVNHLNEQWPGYWIDLFAQRGFEVADCVRPYVWQNENVAFWYAQNMMFFVRRARRDRYKALWDLQAAGWPQGLALVHPGLLQATCERLTRAESEVLQSRESWEKLQRSCTWRLLALVRRILR